MSANGAIASVITSIPNIKIANPTSTAPTLLRLLLFDAIIKIIPTNAIIGENDSGFKSLTKKFELSIPDKLKIHAVIVVPILEPIITPIACDNFIIPELTKPTSITVTADEDCIAAVTPAPNTKLFRGLEVIFFKILSNRPPAIFSKPEDIIVIPYRKNASPPHSVNNENISIN